METNHVADSGAATAGQTKPVVPATVPTVGNPNRVYQLKDLKKVEVSIKGHRTRLWVMDDEAKQQEGMMFLTEGDVKPDEGMLFAFPSIQAGKNPDGSHQGFWMHNTLIPLDIVYLSPAGKVLNVAHGKVQDDTNLPAGGPYRNVIELKAGTAARYGLKTGDVVTIPPVAKG